MSYSLTQDKNTTPDKDWGALTLTLVFVPGVVWGVANGIGTITKGCMSCRAWMNALSEMAMGALVPLWFPFWFLYSIGRICLKKEEDEHNEQYMTALSGMEASLEALPQLVLQLHTILNGHSTSATQMICIASSFLSVSKASIISDMKFGSHEKGDKETSR